MVDPNSRNQKLPETVYGFTSVPKTRKKETGKAAGGEKVEAEFSAPEKISKVFKEQEVKGSPASSPEVLRPRTRRFYKTPDSGSRTSSSESETSPIIGSHRRGSSSSSSNISPNVQPKQPIKTDLEAVQNEVHSETIKSLIDHRDSIPVMDDRTGLFCGVDFEKTKSSRRKSVDQEKFDKLAGDKLIDHLIVMLKSGEDITTSHQGLAENKWFFNAKKNNQDIEDKFDAIGIIGSLKQKVKDGKEISSQIQNLQSQVMYDKKGKGILVKFPEIAEIYQEVKKSSITPQGISPKPIKRDSFEKTQ